MNHVKYWLMLVLATLFWAGNYVFGKYVVTELSPSLDYVFKVGPCLVRSSSACDYCGETELERCEKILETFIASWGSWHYWL